MLPSHTRICGRGCVRWWGVWEPEGLEVSSAALEHRLTICSTFVLQTWQPDIWDFPQSWLQTCWLCLLRETLLISEGQALSPLTRRLHGSAHWQLERPSDVSGCCEWKNCGSFPGWSIYWWMTLQCSPPLWKWSWKHKLTWQHAQYPRFLNDLVGLYPPQAHVGHGASARSKLLLGEVTDIWRLFITTTKPSQSWLIQRLTFCSEIWSFFPIHKPLSFFR